MSISRTPIDTLANVRYRRSRGDGMLLLMGGNTEIFQPFLHTVLQKNQGVSRNNRFIAARRTYRRFDSPAATTRIARTIPIVRDHRHNPAVSYFEGC